MKKGLMLGVCFLLCSVALGSPGQSWQEDKSFSAFWEKFKAAVIQGDKETVIKLSSFPIRMPGRVKAIKDAADLRLRYKEVFNKRTNAAKCFARDDSDPVGQTESGPPKEYAVICDMGTGDVASYSVKLTQAGWKFVRLSQDELPD